MNLPFYEKLNAVQKNYAQFIADRAKSMGIPPELAVAIAYKESGLNPTVQAGSSGEIGIMQVMPKTGKDMGFSEDELRDPVKNIDAGLKYLKKSLDLSDGDPQLAAAGYNAGVNHKFFTSKDALLPNTTVQYVKDLGSFGAFQTSPAAETQAPADEEQISPENLAKREGIDESRARTLGQVGGGIGGAALSAAQLAVPVAKGSAALAGKIFGPTVRDIGKMMSKTGEPSLAGQPPGPPSGIAPPGQPPAPGQPPIPEQPPAGPRPPGPTQLGEPGTFPKATGPGSATFNYARSYGLPEIEAGRALTTGKEAGGVWDLLGKRQEALTGIQQRFPTETFVENPRFGGLMTPDQGVGAGPRASYVQQPGGLQAIPTRTPVPTVPPPSVPAPTPSRGALEEVSQMFKNMMGPKTRAVAGTALKYAAPPLAGIQAGGEFGSMVGELGKQKPDYTKATLSGLGGLGALMSLYPPTMPIGIPLAVGAPLMAGAMEKGRERPLGQISDVVAP